MTPTPELTCPACHGSLYGPVRFCPYCGIAGPAGIESAEKVDAALTFEAMPKGAIPASPQPIQVGAVDDGKRWESACRLDTVEGYREYLQTNTGYQKGHGDEAERRIEGLIAEGRHQDESYWKEAQDQNTVEAYKKYLDANLHVKAHERDAKTRILELVESKKKENRPPGTLDAAGAASAANKEEPPPPPPVRRHWALIGMVLIAVGVVWAYLDRGGSTPERPDQSKEVAGLLEQAKEDISNHRFSTPPSNNALEKFQRVLALQAGNSEALAGIKTIAQQYFDLYNRTLAKGAQDKAREYLDKAVMLDPERFGPRDFSPGFDCRRAVRSSELLICGDRELSLADVRLNNLYQQVLPTALDKNALMEAQNNWRTTVRDACADASCIRLAYSKREAELAAALPGEVRPREALEERETAERAGLAALVRLTVINNNCVPQDYYLSDSLIGSIPPNSGSTTFTVNPGNYSVRACTVGQPSNCGNSTPITLPAGISYTWTIHRHGSCPEALQAMNTANERADKENQEKARVRCEALVDAGRDALQSASYDQAINNARRAKQTYSQCPGADILERDAVEAKRKAREGTTIY